MAHRKTIRSLLLALGLAASVPLGSGCYAYTRGAVVVDVAPPPPRHAYVRARPGFVWVQGYWVSRGGQWVWRDGYWERARPGYVYVQGRWERRAGRYHWVEPRWQPTRREVEVRDHRSAPARVEVRDHRKDKRRAVEVRDHRH